MRSPDQFSDALPDEIVYHQHLETGPNQIIPDLIPFHSLPIQAFKPDQLKSVRPPEQTTFPQSTNYLDVLTARPAYRQNANELLLIQVRSIPYGLGQGRLIYRALDEPCKAYFPHTFGLKSLDFYFRL